MMTTAANTSTRTARRDTLAAVTATQKVVIVNGSPDVLGLLETVLDAGHYDVVFVESNEHAYSQIKRVQPNLVILYVRIDDVSGFQILSMLNLDRETRDIPILTYTTEYTGQGADEDIAEPADDAIFSARPVVVRMN